MLNIASEILIFLEDQKNANFKDFPIKNSRKLRGALGRIQAWKWIKKTKHGKDAVFALTSAGERVIDDNLAILRQPKVSKREEFYLIVYNIKEKQRDLREKLRRGLSELGASILHSGVWIASTDISKQVKDLAKNLEISDKVLILKTEISKDLQKKLADIWNLQDINENYVQFIKEANKFLGKTIDESDRYKIKKLIYTFALNLKKDPMLPEDLLPADWKRKQADQVYQRLRALLA